MPQLEVSACQCARCGHIWLPTGWNGEPAELPKCCAKCKSPYWNTPKRVPDANPVIGHPKRSNVAQHPDSQSVSPQSPIDSPSSLLAVPIKQSNQNLRGTENETASDVARQFDVEVSRKCGHYLGCDCYHCERLRALLRPRTGTKSARDAQAKVSPAKHSRGKR
jgi:hypothetical protein